MPLGVLNCGGVCVETKRIIKSRPCQTEIMCTISHSMCLALKNYSNFKVGVPMLSLCWLLAHASQEHKF